MKFHHICVLGMGYIGLPTACMFASCGLNVTGVDINPWIVATLKNGNIHIHEPGLKELACDLLISGRLKVQDHLEYADAFIIAVPTPFNDEKKADLLAVKNAANSIVPYLRKGNLVVLESTSPPLTTADIVAPILERSGLKAGTDFYLTYSPERVIPGKILEELIFNDRVIGGITPQAAEVGRDLYAEFVRGKIVLTDATTAEMVKLMENTYRDVNIAIAIEFARLADRFGVNIWDAIEIANLHPRVKILKPGIGVGGHCISVDPWFLVEAASDITPLILSARKVNDSQPEFIVNCLEQKYGPIREKRIALLGLSYKPDVDDFRESPAVEVAHLLVKKGALVTGYDPYYVCDTLNEIPMVLSLKEALHGVDIIFLAVGHNQFINLQPCDIASVTECKSIFDPVHGWKEHDWVIAGFSYIGLATGLKTGGVKNG